MTYAYSEDDSWYGFDLDGTLAYHEEGSGAEDVGPFIPRMLQRLRKYLAEGKRCKIFTARADRPEEVVKIKRALLDEGLPNLEVTNMKDSLMVYCYDDRARQVVRNTGVVIGEE